MSNFSISIENCPHLVVSDQATVHIASNKGIPQEQHVPKQATSTRAHTPCQETGDDIIYQAKSGYALVINNYIFPQRTDVERHGSGEDVKGLKSLFDDFNFTTRTHDNLKQSEILELLRETSEKDFGRYDCFVCIILSHGFGDGIFGTDDVLIKIEAITSFFRRDECPSLEGKPKIFLIQACRGNQQDRVPIQRDSEPIPLASSSLPADADFLICFASAPGHQSYRQPELGSWFISTVVEIFKDYAEREHLMDMMLRVNNRVANFFSITGLKQIPCQVCMLRRKVFFNPTYK
ncbi:caspase-3-like isoform X2 [Stylophora pistillata]|uniref:caspase-3-like isoform X2 n=1 Tax=Stylophora pistillata TaxID=50429 RepID=UPI000C03B98B|nr:caspase-3-like isoform X2 [Stylophora pistillata]